MISTKYWLNVLLLLISFHCLTVVNNLFRQSGRILFIDDIKDILVECFIMAHSFS